MTNRGLAFACASDSGTDPLNRVAQANGQHRLARVLQQVNHTARRIFEKNVTPVGQQVILGGGANGVHQPLAEFTLQEANDPADFLQREPALAQLANNGDLGQVIERIDALMAVPGGNHDTALVPPLELTQANAGQFYDVARCERLLQSKVSLKQIYSEMFETSYCSGV